ncbi:nucleotidyltransferase family protein [Nostoc sp.]|uniref:nucleotidyltransferase family protein n=1 Tax=Nostoc sp. TaxID=1180 RepID=UPI002FF7ACC9
MSDEVTLLIYENFPKLDLDTRFFEEARYLSSNFAIVLAAGKSTRMGTCKTSLPWHEGKTLLTYQLEQWLSVDFTPVVVLGSHNSNKQKDLPDGSLAVINFHTNFSKTTSLLTGLQYIPPNFEVLAISAVDQPRKLDIYQRLLLAHQDNFAVITAPTYQGKIGHPLLFSNGMRSHLQNICEESLGLRQIIKEFYPVIHQVQFDNPAVLLDINTPEVYQEQLHNLG